MLNMLRLYCSSFLVAASREAYSLHLGKRCVAGGLGDISSGNGRHSSLAWA